MSVDVEIYMNNIVKFFKSNPNDLLNLVPKDKEDEFYDKIREKCEKNVDEDIDYVLTRQQMIEIVLELKAPELHKKLNTKLEVEGFVMKTKWGEIILN
jgi:hypothetical protein